MNSHLAYRRVWNYFGREVTNTPDDPRWKLTQVIVGMDHGESDPLQPLITIERLVGMFTQGQIRIQNFQRPILEALQSMTFQPRTQINYARHIGAQWVRDYETPVQSILDEVQQASLARPSDSLCGQPLPNSVPREERSTQPNQRPVRRFTLRVPPASEINESWGWELLRTARRALEENASFYLFRDFDYTELDQRDLQTLIRSRCVDHDYLQRFLLGRRWRSIGNAFIDGMSAPPPTTPYPGVFDNENIRQSLVRRTLQRQYPTTDKAPEKIPPNTFGCSDRDWVICQKILQDNGKAVV